LGRLQSCARQWLLNARQAALPMLLLLLLLVCGAEEVLPELARSIGAGSVYCHGEVTAEDAKVEGAVSKALDKAGTALKVRGQQVCVFYRCWVGSLDFEWSASRTHSTR
jgi:hypothetical protein